MMLALALALGIIVGVLLAISAQLAATHKERITRAFLGDDKGEVVFTRDALDDI